MEEEKKEILYCSDCGVEITNDNYYTTADGDIICEECYMDKYFTCPHCGEIYLIDDAIETEDTNEWYCNGCADNMLYRCEDCGAYYENDSNLITLRDGETICQSCLEWGDYGYCDGCGEYFHRDDLNYSDEDDCNYCDDCYDEHERENIIQSWHSHKGEFEKQKTKKDTAKTPLYIGFELETENVGRNIDNYEIAQKIDRIMNGLIVFEKDGSLNYGIEFISQPMTHNFIKENKNKFEKMLEELRSNGFKSHDTSTCGLHIHLSKDYFTENEIDKMQLILERFKDEFIRFSRRDSNQQRHWAKFITDEKGTPCEGFQYSINLKYVKDNKNNYDRYYALNRTNKDTIELRLFKGTLKTSTFFATLQMAFTLAKIVKQKSTKDIEAMYFKDIVTYNKNFIDLKNYCSERGII